jgi:hypothetical protein
VKRDGRGVDAVNEYLTLARLLDAEERNHHTRFSRPRNSYIRGMGIVNISEVQDVVEGDSCTSQIIYISIHSVIACVYVCVCMYVL